MKLFKGGLAILMILVVFGISTQKSYAYSWNSVDLVGYMHFEEPSDMSFVDIECGANDYIGVCLCIQVLVTCDFSIDGYCMDTWGITFNILGGASQTNYIGASNGDELAHQQMVWVSAYLSASSDQSGASGWFEAGWR